MPQYRTLAWVSSTVKEKQHIHSTDNKFPLLKNKEQLEKRMFMKLVKAFRSMFSLTSVSEAERADLIIILEENEKTTLSPFIFLE